MEHTLSPKEHSELHELVVSLRPTSSKIHRLSQWILSHPSSFTPLLSSLATFCESRVSVQKKFSVLLSLYEAVVECRKRGLGTEFADAMDPFLVRFVELCTKDLSPDSARKAKKCIRGWKKHELFSGDEIREAERVVCERYGAPEDTELTPIEPSKSRRKVPLKRNVVNMTMADKDIIIKYASATHPILSSSVWAF
jgi:hypothetical protein